MISLTTIFTPWGTPSPPHHPAGLAHVDLVRVGAQHQPLEQQLAGAVGDQTVTFHLSETETTLSRATFRGLTGQDGARTCGSSVHLVRDHVLQLLVVDGTEEDVGRQAFTSDARRDEVLASVAEAVPNEGIAHILNLAAAKRRAVFLLALKHAGFARDKLKHFPDRHTGWETMRVHDNVRSDALV
ncbi:DNA-directed RNA polymerase III subunit [Hortaea werneckii]|nr:DNA-directed RNA polymerase III subunit [Hortaea werneckii]